MLSIFNFSNHRKAFDSSSIQSMDSSGFDFIDIFEIYRRYCDVRSRKENQNSKEMLAQLMKLVERRGQASSLFYDLSKLLTYLDLTVDSGRFACFYDFVFFMCRENGQKNITVGKAIEAWKVVLKGRFRLLNEWCTFVQKHQRHNISEDTWQQVLAFSRCVHEDLEGYDPKGAWPVLIDDFVDHMHRVTISNFSSTCIGGSDGEDSDAQACRCGIKLFSGSKRKPETDLLNSHPYSEPLPNLKRNRYAEFVDRQAQFQACSPGNDANNQMEMAKHGVLLGCSKNTACAVEGSLSEGFAGLLSNGSCMQIDQKARIINNCFQSH